MAVLRDDFYSAAPDPPAAAASEQPRRRPKESAQLRSGFAALRKPSPANVHLAGRFSEAPPKPE